MSAPQQDSPPPQQQQQLQLHSQDTLLPPATTAAAAAPVECEIALCAICHLALPDASEEVATTNCNHTFCFKCISTWTGSYMSACPLCKESIVVLVRKMGDGTVDEMRVQRVQRLQEEVQSSEMSPQEQFACLDHMYFQAEIASLLRFARQVEEKQRPIALAHRSNYRYKNSSKSDHERKLQAAVEIKEMLQSMEYDFEMLEPFDPIICMQRLYEFHEELRSLQEDVYSSPAAKPTGHQAVEEEKIRYSANDFYEEDKNLYWDESLAEEQQYEEYDQLYLEQHGDNGEY